jgi:hypothetical protein
VNEVKLLDAGGVVSDIVPHVRFDILDYNRLRTGMERRKRKDGKKKWWSADQRLQAAATYVMLGTMTETALATGIPLPTLKAWKNLPWWKDLISQVRRDDLDKASSNIQRVIEKAVKATEERLDNGNFVFDQKTGKIVRIPVNIKDALKVTTELMTKQDKLLEREEQKETQEATVDRLTKLAEELAKFAKTKPVEALEGVVTNSEVLPLPTPTPSPENLSKVG